MHGRPALRAGFGTVKDFLAEDGTRPDGKGGRREEHRQTIRETTGKSSFTQTKTANDGSRSRLDAKEVFLSERRAAEDAIGRQDIPAGYREYLRRYFDGIQPPEPTAGSDGR